MCCGAATTVIANTKHPAANTKEINHPTTNAASRARGGAVGRSFGTGGKNSGQTPARLKKKW